MPATIHLHVGPHKTGSTAIQRALLTAREPLREIGLLYPETGQQDAGHHAIVNAARGWGPASDGFDADALARECEGFDHVVLSSENVVHLARPHLEALRDLLPPGEVRVIYHLRRLVDWWPSYWQELIKHGQSISAAEFLAGQLGGIHLGGNLFVNQADQLIRLEAVFGREAVRIVGYDEMRARDGDLARALLAEVVGRADAAGRVAAEVVNVSKPGWMTEFLRVLNAIHHAETGHGTSARLRVAALDRRKTDRFPAEAAFAALVKARSRPLRVDSRGAAIHQQQMRVVRRFKDRFVGDADAVEAAYLAQTERVVPAFDFPVTGEDALRAALLDWYRTLPEAARA